MSKLVAAPPPSILKNEQLIEMLRDAYEMAERGEIHSAILVVGFHDGLTSDRWSTGAYSSPATLIGAMWLCLTRFTRMYDMQTDADEE